MRLRQLFTTSPPPVILKRVIPNSVLVKAPLLLRVAANKSVFSDAYASLTALLIETRQAAGLTQTELATRLGKPQSFVSKIETGERRIDVIEFCVVARALGVEPADLLRAINLPETLAI